MIKYEGIESKYFYNNQDVDKILDVIENGNYYNIDNCTKENITDIINAVNNFIANIKEVKQQVTLERHETEEEAREYFGQDFIDKFDKLLTILDQQKTIVAIHGTRVEVCSEICDTGLQYKSPSLSATAVQQSMAYGQREMHYENYESLLNWGHKNYKGLVIIAVPYECYYKEGLWNHFQETNSSAYGGQDYRIDPDFIVGYLDVSNKQIVINPKYNRQHDYSGYEFDAELFRKQKNMDNDKLTQAMIESEKLLYQEKSVSSHEKVENEEETIDIERIPYVIEDLIGIFNSIKNGSPDGLSESRYKYLLEQLSLGFSNIQKSLPLLKTNEQVKNEKEKEYSIFYQNENTDSFDASQNNNNNNNNNNNEDWGENIDWDFPSIEEDNSMHK